MPIISVKLLRGRDSSTKRQLVKELAEATVRVLGVQEQAVRVILTEIDDDHWGIGARTKAEIDESKG
jgi:4-oxalocrotonate tautomerase